MLDSVGGAKPGCQPFAAARPGRVVARPRVFQVEESLTVSAPDREYGGQSGGQCTERLRVVDWETPANNDFLLVSQLTVTGPLYTCLPDLVGFVWMKCTVVNAYSPTRSRTARTTA